MQMGRYAGETTAPVWLRKATYRKTVQNLWWATGSSVTAMPPPAGGRPLETSAEMEQGWDSLRHIQAADARDAGV